MTNQFLSKEFLETVRRRCELATKGPWISSIEGRDHTSGDSVIITGDREKDIYLIGASVEDQDFIARARQDIPMLLEEIERLQGLIQKTDDKE